MGWGGVAGGQIWHTDGFCLSDRVTLNIQIHCQCLKLGVFTAVFRFLASLDNLEIRQHGPTLPRARSWLDLSGRAP